MIYRSFLSAAFFLALFSSCTTPTQKNGNAASAEAAMQDGHPSWVMQGNIYEVNIRQYTPEGTFNGFAAHLERLKKMGVQTLWFMPIHPISKKDRKGELGSYYAISSYYDINPEFGSLEDWKTLVKKAKEMGFRVLMDWVPNHTGADHSWIRTHPSFYVIDSLTGQPLAPFDWSDVRELNYDNREMRDSMMAALKYWLNTVPIDGYRVDVAWGVPDDFWKECIPQLKKIQPELFMLAEAEGPNFHEDGFDATYPWSFFHTMNKIAAGKSDVASLDSLIALTDSSYPSNALRLYFTSNHDENSWNKADYGTMPGAVHAPFAVLTQTYARSLPLIYSGQEEPVLDSIRFFYKAPIAFKDLAREPFYKILLHWREKHPALNGSIPAVRLSIGNPKYIFSFSRESGGKKIVVVLNLSATAQRVSLQGIGSGKKGFNIFNEKEIAADNMQLSLAPWDYKVYNID